MPAPFVPSDCDVRSMPYMPLDVVRLLQSDLYQLATPKEFRAAVILWCHAWIQVPSSSLPDSSLIHRRFVLEESKKEWDRISPMALRGFVLCDDGRLYHPVIAEKALKAWHMIQAAKHAAAKRWHHKSDAPAYPTAHAIEFELKQNITKEKYYGSKENPPIDKLRGLRDVISQTHFGDKIPEGQPQQPQQPETTKPAPDRPTMSRDEQLAYARAHGYNGHPKDQHSAITLPKGWNKPGEDKAILEACKILGVSSPGKDYFTIIRELQAKLKERQNP